MKKTFRVRAITTSALALVTALGLSVVLAGCSATTSEPPIVVSHLHAVDIDDESGDIYLATHEGILRATVESGADDVRVGGVGSVERLGAWRGDVMGMARLDDTIYLSGHPAPDTDAPMNIGVYTTDRSGAEFASLALEGDADFHSMAVMAAADGSTALAGIDSVTGRVVVSRDGGATWSAGAALGARSVSWDADAERLFATTEQGLQVSIDDGATFTLVDSAPVLLLISAPPPSTPTGGLLMGLDLDGRVHLSADGETWTPAGLAPPGTEAIAVGRRGTLVAAGLDGVHRSDDRGATWSIVAEF